MHHKKNRVSEPLLLLDRDSECEALTHLAHGELGKMDIIIGMFDYLIVRNA